MKAKKILFPGKFNSFVLFVVSAAGFISIYWAFGLIAGLEILAIATLCYVIWRLIQIRPNFRNMGKEIEKILGQPIGAQIKTREVLLDLMKVRSGFINDQVEIDLLSYDATIDSDGNYYGLYRVTGRNMDLLPCEGLKVITGSSSFEVTKTDAIDTDSGNKLKIKSFEYEIAEVFTFEILFQQPLAQSDNFDVSWRFELPHACSTKGDDADVFLMWPYKKIKGHVKIDIRLIFQPKAIQLYHVKKNSRVHIHTEDKPTKSSFMKGKYVYSILINNPALYHAFIFIYRI